MSVLSMSLLYFRMAPGRFTLKNRLLAAISFLVSTYNYSFLKNKLRKTHLTPEGLIHQNILLDITVTYYLILPLLDNIMTPCTNLEISYI